MMGYGDGAMGAWSYIWSMALILVLASVASVALLVAWVRFAAGEIGHEECRRRPIVMEGP